MCKEHVHKPPEELNENIMNNQEITEHMLEQADPMLGQYSPQLGQVPENNLNLSIGGRQSLRAHEHLNNVNANLEGILLTGVVQVPEEADLDEKQKNIKASKRTDKSRKNHRAKSAKLQVSAERTKAISEEMKGLLDNSKDVPIASLKIIEDNCLKSGIEGIRLLAESRKEAIKSKGEKDTEEIHYLTNAELQKNISIQQLYKQLLSKNQKISVLDDEGKNWMTQQAALYNAKIKEYDKIITKQRESVENSGILYKLSQKITGVKDEIGSNKRDTNKLAKDAPISIDTLSYHDFSKMIGTYSRGQVAFSEKGLTAINNGKFSTQSNELSRDNLLIRQRFLRVVMDKMGGMDKMRENGTEEFFALTRNRLGLNNEAQVQAEPLSRRLIQDIISEVNENASIVAKNLKANKPQSVIEMRISKNINGILGGRTDKEKEQEINSILSVLKGYISETPNLNKHQMDNLLKGNIPLLRDEIFASVNTICDQIQTIGKIDKKGKNDDEDVNARAFNVESFLADKEAMNILAAFHIQKMAAGTEAGARLEDLKLQSYMENVAFAYAKPTQGLQENINNANIESLASQGSEGLSKLLGEADTKDEKDIIREFIGLCNNIKEVNDIRAMAFKEKLDKAKSIRLGDVSDNIDSLFSNKDRVAQYDKIIPKIKNTRFEEGYQRAKDLVLTRGFSFSAAYESIIPKNEDFQDDNIEDKEKNPINLLSGKAKNIASVLSGESHASGYITKKNNDPFAMNMQNLRSFLNEFKGGKTLAKTISFDGQDIVFVQDSHKILKMIVDKVSVPLVHSADKIAEHLESEIILNDKAFPQEIVKKILGDMESAPENSAGMFQSRNVCIDVLKGKTGKPGTFFNNISSSTLLSYVKEITAIDTYKKSNKESERMLKDVVDVIINGVNDVVNANYINGKEASELIMQLEREKWREKNSNLEAKVTREKEQPNEDAKQEQWTANEKKIVDLVADMIFSNDSWVTDELKDQPGARMKKVLQENVTALSLLIRQPTMITSILDRMPLGGEEEASQIKTLVSNQVEAILADPLLSTLRDGEEKMDKGNNGSMFSQFKQGLNFIGGAIKDKAIETGISLALKSKENAKSFIDIEKNIDELIDEQSEQIQDMFNQSLESMYSENEAEQEKNEAEQEKNKANQDEKDEVKSVEGLNRIIKDAVKGKTGQGKFLKNVFTSYFSDGSSMDKHAMFAAALRYSVPKRKLPEAATEKEKEQEEDRARGSFIGGFLKGAGPLLQKTLQGIPSGAMPSYIDAALKDMKSNLAPIPPKYVDAQLNAMVNRSKGEITHIHLRKSLGAASVGQAFLCTMYGPNVNKNGEGKGEDVVIKLLRPDVRNRIEREKKIMIKAAEDTDVNGGMKATYLGQLERIEEEMDLTIEAKNAQSGEIYNNAQGTVKSMKLNPLMEPTMNALVLEKAPGTTLDRYMNDVSIKRKEVLREYSMKSSQKEEKSLPGDDSKNKDSEQQPEKAVEEIRRYKATLIRELNEVQKRQTYLTTMAKEWVTEGVYGGGFYHGDLHAGNIMVDDKGLTLIDFGNATQLDLDQKTNILRMMSSAAAGEEFTGMFQDAFHKLLGGASEDAYKDKKGELGTVFNDILKHGESKDAGLRICAALMKSQDLGVEVPSAIYNFSQSQMRLQSAIEDMNKLIADLQKNICEFQEVESNYDSVVTDKDVPLPEIAGVKVHNQNPFNLTTNYDVDVKDVTREQFSQQLQSEDGSLLQETLESVSYKAMGEEAKKTLFMRLISANDALKAAQKDGNKTNSTLLDEMKPALERLPDEVVSTANRNGLRMEVMCASDAPNIEEYNTKFSLLKQSIIEIAKNSWPEFDADKVRTEVNDAWGKFAEKAEADEDKLLQLESEYRSEKAKKGVDPTHLNELEGKVYNQYDKMNNTIKMNTGNFLKFRNACRDEKGIEQIDNDMKIWVEAASNLSFSTGRELQMAYTSLKKAYKSDDANVLGAEKDFFNAIQSVIDQITTKKIAAREKRDENFDNSPPQDFIDVMSNVITNNLFSSLKRLGLIEGMRIGQAMKV